MFPANILILLDKSGSMNAYDFYGEEIPADGIYGLEPIPGTGNYIYHTGWGLGGYNDSALELAPIVQGNSKYEFRNNSCSTLSDSSNILYHNNHIYFDGMPGGQYQPATLCKVNTTTGTTTSVIENIQPVSMKGLKKHNDIIILANKTTRKIYLHNSATNNTVTCSPSGILRQVLGNAADHGNKVVFAIDASGNLVFAPKYPRPSYTHIYKFRLNGMSCPSNSPSYQVDLRDKVQLDGQRSMVAHPTNDKIIYL